MSTYQVRSGDTLWAIAARHGMSLAALEAANPQLRNPNLIYPGQALNLPDAFSPARASPPIDLSGRGHSSLYTVRSGDTLSAIGARFGVSYQAIAAANHLANPNLIYPGQVLTIPGARGATSGGAASKGGAPSPGAPASVQNIINRHPAGSYGGQCSGFVAAVEGVPGFPRADGLGPCNGNQMVNWLCGRGWARVSSPRPGDVFSMNIGTYGHTGIVVGVQGNMVSVIDSNWNLDQRVHVHQIPLSHFSGFARKN